MTFLHAACAILGKMRLWGDMENIATLPVFFKPCSSIGSANPFPNDYKAL